jgi:hypothetical protein
LVEAKLILRDLSILDCPADKKPGFNVYADGWLRDYCRIECKTSTANGDEAFSISICGHDLAGNS